MNASNLEKLIVRYHNSKIFNFNKFFIFITIIRFNIKFYSTHFWLLFPLQNQEIKKANQVEEEQVKSKNSWIKVRIRSRTYLTSEEIYHLLEKDAEGWSADGSKSYDDGEVDHVSENALSDLSEEESIDIPSVRPPNSFVLRNGSEIWSCDPVTTSTDRAAAYNVFQKKQGHCGLQTGNVVQFWIPFCCI